MDFLAEMVEHAAMDNPHEACGLVVAVGDQHRLIRARNLSQRPRETFQLDEEAWLKVGDGEEVVGIYHSHPLGSPEPSPADLTMCEATGMTWHIVTPAGGYRRVEPSGYRAPYLRRPYVHGVHDCYAVIRDWFNWEWNLDLPDFDRSDDWWSKGDNLYMDNFASCGFEVIERQAPEIGDAFFFRIQSPVPNHAAVYVGKGEILHHVRGRLSTKESYSGLWQKLTTHQLRHNKRMGTYG